MRCSEGERHNGGSTTEGLLQSLHLQALRWEGSCTMSRFPVLRLTDDDYWCLESSLFWPRFIYHHWIRGPQTYVHLLANAVNTNKPLPSSAEFPCLYASHSQVLYFPSIYGTCWHMLYSCDLWYNFRLGEHLRPQHNTPLDEVILCMKIRGLRCYFVYTEYQTR